MLSVSVGNLFWRYIAEKTIQTDFKSVIIGLISRKLRIDCFFISHKLEAKINVIMDLL